MEPSISFRSLLANAPVFLPIVVWGVSSWVIVNGVFVELPTFASRLPEGWALGSQLSFACMIANIIPFFYFSISLVINRRFPEWVVILVILFTGIVSSILLGLKWDETGELFGRTRSVWLLSLTFVGSILDCTSSLVYWPYVSSHHGMFTTALAVGESMSGGVMSVLGLLQDQGGAQNFSTKIYFFLCSLVTSCSMAAFLFIHFSSCGLAEVRPGNDPEMIDDNELRLGQTKEESGELDAPVLTITRVSATAGCGFVPQSTHLYALENASDVNLAESSSPWVTARYLFRHCCSSIAVILLANFVENGMIPAVTTYAFLRLPHGKHVMSICTNVALLLCPLACLATSAVLIRDLRAPALVITALSLYLFLASLPFVHIFSGSWMSTLLISVVYIVLRPVISFSKTTSFLLLKERVPLNSINRTFFVSGFATQVGSGIGALIFFILVNYTDVYSP